MLISVLASCIPLRILSGDFSGWASLKFKFKGVVVLGSSYLNTFSLLLESRVIRRPAGLALNWPGSYPFPPGLVVWWVPLLLGGGAGLPSQKSLWFSNEFNKPVLE